MSRSALTPAKAEINPKDRAILRKFIGLSPGYFADNVGWADIMCIVDHIQGLPAIGDTSGFIGAYYFHSDPWHIDIVDYSRGEEKIISVQIDEQDRLGATVCAILEFIKWHKNKTTTDEK